MQTTRLAPCTAPRSHNLFMKAHFVTGVIYELNACLCRCNGWIPLQCHSLCMRAVLLPCCMDWTDLLQCTVDVGDLECNLNCAAGYVGAIIVPAHSSCLYFICDLGLWIAWLIGPLHLFGTLVDARLCVHVRSFLLCFDVHCCLPRFLVV
jgi:hypothetical protein